MESSNNADAGSTGEGQEMGVEREGIIELMALLEEVENRLSELDNDEWVSDGSTLADIDSLRDRLVKRGKWCGVINESTNTMTLQSQASEIDITLRKGDGAE